MKRKIFTKYAFLASFTAALSAAGSSAAYSSSLIPEFPEKEELLAIEESATEAVTEYDAEPASEAQAQSAEASEETVENMTETMTEAISEALSEGMTEKITEAPAESSSEASSGSLTKSASAELPLHFSYLDAPHYLCPGYMLPPAHQLPHPEPSLVYLRRELEAILSGYEGTWSVAVKDLSTDEQTVIGNAVMPSASTLKLFILGCVYEEIDAGRLERTEELVSLMNSMIRASSNEAANRIMAILGDGDYQAGIDKINAYIEEEGYSDATRAYNPFQDQSLKLDPEHVNTTSAADCMLLLERIYRRRFGSRKACNETEDMLLNQEIRYKIPKGIGDTALAANKTGETDEIENDIALIYTPKGDYILCVFSTGWQDKKAAQSHITELSAKVYSYFADPEAFMNIPAELEGINAGIPMPAAAN